MPTLVRPAMRCRRRSSIRSSTAFRGKARSRTLTSRFTARTGSGCRDHSRHGCRTSSAQGADDLRLREDLTERRRATAPEPATQGCPSAPPDSSAGALIAESIDVGLLLERPEIGNLLKPGRCWRACSTPLWSHRRDRVRRRVRPPMRAPLRADHAGPRHRRATPCAGTVRRR